MIRLLLPMLLAVVWPSSSKGARQGLTLAVVDISTWIRAHAPITAGNRDALITAVRDTLDERLDELPEWGELEEGRRDTILSGVAELIGWAWSIPARS